MSIPRAGYRAIAADLETGIENGKYPAGSKLPTYAELAVRYNVSVTTSQRAVLLIQERGLATGIPGRGVYVVEEVEGAPSRAPLKPGRRPITPAPPVRQQAGRAAKRSRSVDP